MDQLADLVLSFAADWFAPRDRRVFETREAALCIGEFPTEPTGAGPDDVRRSGEYLVHIADKRQWEAQLGEYAPLSSGGAPLERVQLVDYDRLGNLVRRKYFTRSVVLQERERNFNEASLDNDAHLKTQIEDEENVMVLVPVDTAGVEFVGPLNWPVLTRRLDRDKDRFVVDSLVFDIESLEVAMPEDWEVAAGLEKQQRERDAVKKQDQF